MNKAALTEKMTARLAAGGISLAPTIVEAVLHSGLEVIKEALASGDSVALKGFGKFETVERAARPGRNPQTGEAIHIPASRGVKFAAGKDLKKTVNHVGK